MSIKAIKAQTGFSYSTISRVLSGKADAFRISTITREQILEAAARLNYRPNILARSLRLRKTMTVGLIVSDIQNPFFGELASRIEQDLRFHGYSMILCNTNEVPENEEFYLKLLVDRKVDGILIAPIQTAEWESMQILVRETPVVLVDRIFADTALPWVTSANVEAAEEVTREILGRGYRKIAFLGGPPETHITRARFKGFRKAVVETLGRLDESFVLSKGYTAQAGREMMIRLLDERPDVEAVLCVNNLVFYGAVGPVNDFELRQARPVMMAGFDIGEYASLMKRPLISADQNLAELARSAVGLLLEADAGAADAANHLTIPVVIARHRLP
ncbi:MAG: LacI family DNA-binding transcriptional regulator [Candidatus Aminicenantes bacterium]|nr:LacI family DNA-binding transcriptional regulator [Candidatus Aminicenantes bacterium]